VILLLMVVSARSSIAGYRARQCNYKELESLLPSVDYLFANEDEARIFARKFGWEVSPSRCRIASLRHLAYSHFALHVVALSPLYWR